MSDFGKERCLDRKEDSFTAISEVDACTKKIKTFSGPASNNDESQKLFSPIVDVDKGKQKAISAPRTINPLDPFDVFDAGTVRIIITELDAPDTETLRRVCKRWKASSEFHCRRALLRQHFPEATASLSEDEIWSVEEENLRFRRHLYCRRSFELGYATRAFRCTGASSWDLKNDILLWSNPDGEISFRTLRADRVGVQGSAQVTHEKLDLRRLPIPSSYVEQVSLLEDGDLIVQSFIRHDRRRIRPIEGQQNPADIRIIARFDKAGQILWEITTYPQTWSKPAIGKKELFFIMKEFGDPLLSFDGDPKLIKYSLQDGLIVPDFEPIGQESHCMEINRWAATFFLTNNEKFAVWTDTNDIISIISVSNGECVRRLLKGYGFVVSKSFIDESLWVIDLSLQDAEPDVLQDPIEPRFSYFVPLKENTFGLNIQPIEFPSMLGTYSRGALWVFDANSAVLFRTAIDSRPEYPFKWQVQHLREENVDSVPMEPVEDRKIPASRVVLAATHQLPSNIPGHIRIETKAALVEVSLPASSGQLGQRRPLDVDVPPECEYPLMWSPKHEGCFRMAENYLLYHFSDQEVLFLIDFWPSW